MRKYSILLMVLAGSLSCGPFEQDESPSWLFVMRAPSAVVVKTTAGFDLTLTNADPQTLAFSDRPVRKAMVLVTNTFMKDWSDKTIFKSSQPNGAIILDSLRDANGDPTAWAIELKNPSAAGPNSWKFEIKALDGTLTPGSYTGVSIFIDNVFSHFPIATPAVYHFGRKAYDKMKHHI